MIELENIILDDEGIKKVLIIGLGQLGLPVARYVREKGFDTYGYDISIVAMERAQKIAGIKEVTDLRLMHSLFVFQLTNLMICLHLR
jgi:UDP-N-acetyl-D-mannosaminuronic acid dehydrogenase